MEDFLQPCLTADLSDPLSHNELFLVTRNIEQKWDGGEEANVGGEAWENS